MVVLWIYVILSELFAISLKHLVYHSHSLCALLCKHIWFIIPYYYVSFLAVWFFPMLNAILPYKPCLRFDNLTILFLQIFVQSANFNLSILFFSPFITLYLFRPDESHLCSSFGSRSYWNNCSSTIIDEITFFLQLFPI